MKQGLVIFLTLFFCLVFQTTLLGDVNPRPDGVIVVTLAVAFLRGPFWGCLTGFTGGFLEDGLSGSSHGLFCLTDFAVGFCFGLIWKHLYSKNLMVLTLAVVSGTFVYVVFFRLLGVGFGWLSSFHFPPSFVIWLFAEGALSLIVLFFFKRWLFPETYVM